MQYASAQALVVGAKLGEDRGDFYRVGDVRVAAPAHLALMPSRRDVVGALEQLDIGIRPGSSKGSLKPRNLVTSGWSRVRCTAVHSPTSGMPSRLAVGPDRRIACAWISSARTRRARSAPS